ncbi:hypothetical protein ACJMK2_023430 [Sinanodonta woodiana]|uniref:Uncharacterized protein n=1 Tax=Sinanodonta woodiana TaxID=1069815 RepID=A0ABD3T480_SINWO
MAIQYSLESRELPIPLVNLLASFPKYIPQSRFERKDVTMLPEAQRHQQEISSADFKLISGADLKLISGADFKLISGADFKRISSADFKLISGAHFKLISGAHFKLISGAHFKLISGAHFKLTKFAIFSTKLLNIRFNAATWGLTYPS